VGGTVPTLQNTRSIKWQPMTKRYREAIAVSLDGGAQPEGFSWRGAVYRVGAVLGHWREDASYWSGGGVEIPQRDLWRVDTGRGGGVYELVCENGRWRLDRIWD
jgi:hypothetical protein